MMRVEKFDRGRNGGKLKGLTGGYDSVEEEDDDGQKERRKGGAGRGA